MASGARRWKFPIVVICVQIIFIVIFGVLAEYTPSAQPKDTDTSDVNVDTYYPMFQDINVMIFAGFGFLMTFLKRYGYSSVSVNLLLAALLIQWATIVRGLLHNDVTKGRFPVGVIQMMTGNFAAAAVLISFGAVLGKTSPMQLLVMALLETLLSQVNELIGLDYFSAQDVGESMYIHAFGAYFGLAVAFVLYNKNVEDSTKEGSVYHSDVFSMIGTIFLWIYWPSFNAVGVLGDERHRAIINTFFSLTASTLVTFAISALTNKRGKLDMVHIQNATLAGGVVVGTTAHMDLQIWAALLMGSVAGAVSTLGYKYFTPCLAGKMRVHDTCGVNNLHGMPGILAGLAGAVVAAVATRERYGSSLVEIFPAMANATANTTYQGHVLSPFGRTPSVQAAYQLAALGTTLGLAIVGGLLTGLILKAPIWDQPEPDELFEDEGIFEVAEEGGPISNGVKKYVEADGDTRM